MSNLADMVMEWPEAAPVGLLDTRKTSEHLRLESPPTNELAEAKKQRRKSEHRRLVQVLGSMACGEHGQFAQTIGEKWIGDVAHCGGRSSVHLSCRQVSWLPQSCKFPLCPWYQASRAKKAGEQLHQLWMKGLFISPSFATFTVQNAERLGDCWDDLSHALKALHRRRYIKGRVRGGFRNLEFVPASTNQFVFGKPDKINFTDTGNKNYIYIKEKFKIKCERKFEVNPKGMIVGFTSKNCF